MSKTVPCLWFDGQAEQAARHYTAIFPNSAITGVARGGPAAPGVEGGVATVDFVLDGQEYLALNGNPTFPFTEAISFQIHTGDQAETDHFWNRLGEGGQESRCGWLRDRFGVSWQVVPTALLALLQDPDPDRARRATQAMLGMGRIVIADLHRAADGA